MADPAYFDAIFHSLPQVMELYQAQAELGQANESIASACFVACVVSLMLIGSQEHNLSLQNDLYKLRSDTKTVFDEAKALEARWAELQREQKDLYQVRTTVFPIASFADTERPALYAPVPFATVAACDDGPRRSVRGPRIFLCPVGCN
jgi:hypothetical protein